MITIILLGRVPSKKNSRQLFVKNGRMMNIPSKPYREWHIEASNQLKIARIPSGQIETVECINIRFWSADKRAWDVSNKTESIMDLLVDNKIILDDNYEVVPVLNLEYMGVEKGGRTEIDIYTC